MEVCWWSQVRGIRSVAELLSAVRRRRMHRGLNYSCCPEVRESVEALEKERLLLFSTYIAVHTCLVAKIVY